jgi:hypothetical protein
VPTPEARRPLLVLLDLNGTLVHRDTATAPFVVRPGALPLLLDLTLCKHLDLGFCTSMQPKNARRAVKALVEAAEEAAAADAAAKQAAETSGNPRRILERGDRVRVTAARPSPDSRTTVTVKRRITDIGAPRGPASH